MEETIFDLMGILIIWCVIGYYKYMPEDRKTSFSEQTITGIAIGIACLFIKY